MIILALERKKGVCITKLYVHQIPGDRSKSWCSVSEEHGVLSITRMLLFTERGTNCGALGAYPQYDIALPRKKP